MYKIKLELLNDCNLRCKYCFVQHRLYKPLLQQEKDRMDNVTAQKAIDFGIERAVALGQKDICVEYFGGEPLLKFDDIVILTEYANEKARAKGLDIYYEMVTNGTLFNNKVSEFCAEKGFKVKISMDGTKQNHDKNRVDAGGQPTYNLIIKNINAINHYQEKLRRPVQISMVISRNTFRSFYENFSHLVNLGFSFIDCAINYCEGWDIASLEILEKEFEKAAEFYIDRAKAGREFAWTFIDKGLRPILGSRKHYYCGAGVIHNFITTDGSIFPCSVCTKDEVKQGNIVDGYQNEEWLKQYRRYERSLSDKCAQCDIKQYCSTCDCILMNYELTSHYNQVSEVLCEYTKMRYRIVSNLLLDNDFSGLVNHKMGRKVI